MATNYIQPGNVITLIAPYALGSGGGVQVGTIFGCATGSAAQGAEVEVEVVGVWRLPKLSAQAWTVGQPVYWDDTNKWATTVASSNLLIGKALAITANPSTTGTVRLNG